MEEDTLGQRIRRRLWGWIRSLVRNVLGFFHAVSEDGPGLSTAALALGVAWAVDWLRLTLVLPILISSLVVWQVAQRTYKQRLESAQLQWKFEFLEALPETAPESVEWLNHMLSLLWHDVFEPKVAARIVYILQRKLSKTPAKFMESPELTEFTLGTASPRVHTCRVCKHKGDTVLDLDVDFKSQNLHMAIETRVQLGDIPGKISAKIRVNAFHISTKFRVRPLPKERVALISYSGQPKVHLDLNVVGLSTKAFPVIDSWMETFVRGALAKTCGEPRRLCVELPNAGRGEAVTKPKPDTGTLFITLVSLRLFESAGPPPCEGGGVAVSIKCNSEHRSSRMQKTSSVGVGEEGRFGRWAFGADEQNASHHFLIRSANGCTTVAFSGGQVYDGERAIGSCLIQCKWLKDGSTVYWHNQRGGRPTAWRHTEPYDISLPVIGPDSAEVGEARLVCHLDWNYGEAKALEKDLHNLKISQSMRVVDGVLASRQGFWIITIIEARNLVARDKNGKSDPYCKVKVGRKKHTTKVKSKTLNPRWNETFSFLHGTRLVIVCYDYDRFGFDNDFLGIAELDLLPMKDSKPHDLWIPLTATESGEIHLRVIFEKRRDANRSGGLIGSLRSLRWPSSSASNSSDLPVMPSNSHHSPGGGGGGGGGGVSFLRSPQPSPESRPFPSPSPSVDEHEAWHADVALPAPGEDVVPLHLAYSQGRYDDDTWEHGGAADGASGNGHAMRSLSINAETTDSDCSTPSKNLSRPGSPMRRGAMVVGRGDGKPIVAKSERMECGIPVGLTLGDIVEGNDDQDRLTPPNSTPPSRQSIDGTDLLMVPPGTPVRRAADSASELGFPGVVPALGGRLSDLGSLSGGGGGGGGRPAAGRGPCGAEALEVTLVEASHLVVKDFFRKRSDPFCKLKLRSSKRKSTVQSGSLNPIWNEAFEFPIVSSTAFRDDDVLVMECRDKDMLGSDYLGSARVMLRDLSLGETHDLWMPLKGVSHGRLHIIARLRPAAIPERQPTAALDLKSGSTPQCEVR